LAWPLHECFEASEVNPDPGDVALRWLAAFNAGDADAVAALYSEDAIHESPKVRRAMPASGGRLTGKAAIRDWFREAIARTPGMSYDLSALTSDDSRVVIEYMRRAPGEEPLAVAEAFAVRHGKIVHSVVYHFDW
jgi:steroid delta-isomerase-like uncharacterized protein